LRTTAVGSGDPDADSICRPGYPPNVHGADAVLFRATVVSMVPAAPLLPTTEPERDDEVQRAGPTAAVVVGAPDDVDVVATVVVDVVVEAGAPVVVDVDGLDEQALRTVPPTRAAATAAATTTGLVTLGTLIDRPRPSHPRRLRHPDGSERPGPRRQYGPTGRSTSGPLGLQPNRAEGAGRGRAL
jgi:hypothetical protein